MSWVLLPMRLTTAGADTRQTYINLEHVVRVAQIDHPNQNMHEVAVTTVNGDHLVVEEMTLELFWNQVNTGGADHP